MATFGGITARAAGCRSYSGPSLCQRSEKPATQTGVYESDSFLQSLSGVQFVGNLGHHHQAFGQKGILPAIGRVGRQIRDVIRDASRNGSITAVSKSRKAEGAVDRRVASRRTGFTAASIPDMRFINREVPIDDVARALQLRLDGANRIHCWHPERHKNGDRTASVGVRTANNTVKCFGCDSKPMGPIDFAMDVLGMASAADAALWIAGKFDVPTIPVGKRLEEPERSRFRAGYEDGLDLLVRSGLWGTLSGPAHSIAAVFSSMSEKSESTAQAASIRLSYAGIKRYSGVSSPNAIRKALLELVKSVFCSYPRLAATCLRSARRRKYVVTPNSDELSELAQAFWTQTKAEIAAERELRSRLKAEKTRAWREKPNL